MTLNVAVKNALVAAVYCLLAVTSLQFAYHASNATPVWPPSGFAPVEITEKNKKVPLPF